MYLLTRLEVHAVDDTVGVNVFAVDMRTDQNLAALEISGEPASCFVRRARVNVRTLREALHHVVKHHAAILAVQQLRTEEFIERGFRLAANAADELLTVPKRLAELGNIAHDTFHAAARLRTLFVVHEMDDCDFATPPSCNSRRAVLILANACASCIQICKLDFPHIRQHRELVEIVADGFLLPQDFLQVRRGLRYVSRDNTRSHSRSGSYGLVLLSRVSFPNPVLKFEC